MYYVYRLYDNADKLLYVGFTQNLRRRMIGHKTATPWYNDIARIESETVEDKTSALVAEFNAIAGENPLHNVYKRTVSPAMAARAAHIESLTKSLARDMEMHKLREGGMTLIEIGNKFGITRQRVQQIVGKMPRPHKYRPRLRP